MFAAASGTWFISASARSSLHALLSGIKLATINNINNTDYHASYHANYDANNSASNSANNSATHKALPLCLTFITGPFSMIDLSPFPRIRLAHLPTPLQPLHRLSKHLGGPMIWMKRDDCTGLAFGGNKTRKLEFLMAEAVQQNAELVVTFGAWQSNHVRQTVAACAQLGLACEPILSASVPITTNDYKTSGNYFLDELMGAQLNTTTPDKVRETFAALRARETRKLYVIPTGGSNATGSLGYVDCAQELGTQLQQLGIKPSAVIHASSSAGTQAGLIVGMSAAAQPIPVLGINVYETDHQHMTSNVRKLVTETADKVGVAAVDDEMITINHDYLGDGYGLPTDAMLDAVTLLATLEGVLLDPVYSGKAMAAMIDMIRGGSWSKDQQLVFVHTGGAPTLFAYQAQFAAPAGAASE
jgi:L-cysteate sulfo-lyase